MTTSPDYVVVADPESLRWQHYQRDLHEFLSQFRPRPQLHVLPWPDVVHRDGEISDLLPKRSALFRVESPARDFELARLLMQAGEIDAGIEASQWHTDLEGWIASPKMMYRGLCRILHNLDDCLRDQPHCRTTSSLPDTQVLFDKNAVSEQLHEHEIPTPNSFRPTSHASVLDQHLAHGWTQSYVKLAYGSCASGIAMLNSRSRPVKALTTVIEIENRFYNTYRGRDVVDEELNSILRFLVRQDATVQQAIPKARIDRNEFDVRVVMIDGQPAASVFRANSIPITNLHLGGYRADPAACRRLISKRAWADAVDVCWQASQRYAMAALGIDLAFDANTWEPKIIEINAFGDFFPNWKNEAGKSLHLLEIEATAKRLRRGD
ncbi:MAG: STM4014 family protein [Rubripirellula sp.]